MENEVKYMFEWCNKCYLLDICYYQHGKKTDFPYALDHECGYGPFEKEG